MHENGKYRKHTPNMEHCDESQKHRRIFLINTSKRASKGFKNESPSLSSSLEAIFIVSWAPDTNLETEPKIVVAWE